MSPQALGEIDDAAGWQLVRSDELRLSYRHEHGTHVHSFKVGCRLDAPMEVGPGSGFRV